MEQRDFLKRQIDQIGLILGKLLSDLIKGKRSGKIDVAISITNQTLQNELDLDLEKLISIPSEELITTLKIKQPFVNAHLEQLADLLLIIAEDGKMDSAKNLYQKALTIYSYLEAEEKSYSFERQSKIIKIKNIIS